MWVFFSARKSYIYKMANGSIDDELINNACFEEYATSSPNHTSTDNYEWYTYRKFLVDSSQPCNEMLKLCIFGLEKMDCMKLFDTVLSDEGIYIHKIYLFDSTSIGIDLSHHFL